MSISLTSIASIAASSVPHTFPQMRHKLDDLAADNACPLELLASVILSDPGASALVLSKAISAQHESKMVSTAVSRFGLSMVRGISLELQDIPGASRSLHAALWTQANACATMTRLLSKECHVVFEGAETPEQFHLIGLLHDLGSICAARHFTDGYIAAGKELQKKDGHTFGQCLRNQIGISNHDLGALICRSLRLPEIYMSCNRFHNRPEKATKYQNEVALIHIAKQLIVGCGFTVGGNSFIRDINEEAMARLHLHEEELMKVITAFFKSMDDISHFEGGLI